MGLPQAAARFDREAYFEWEAAQADKSEYLAGEVFAMVGARQEHGVVGGALYARFREHLRGTRCRAHVADMKLEVQAADAVFYPDVMVSCDEADRQRALALQSPCLIVEVLSDSTAAFDRGNKFAAYRKLPSLQEYLLVDIDARRIELYRLVPTGWVYEVMEPGGPGSLQLESIALTLTATDAFGDLDEPAAPTGTAPAISA
ncbi:MAG TPA: Uma2 family endonuclease [Ideonella sp.]|nr:Uma2 family endonuclease [Ideonella sp.]